MRINASMDTEPPFLTLNMDLIFITSGWAPLVVAVAAAMMGNIGIPTVTGPSGSIPWSSTLGMTNNIETL